MPILKLHSKKKTMPKIYCHKLKKEEEQLDKPPFPGDMGMRIFKEISKPAWNQWLSQQTMIINENHLALTDPESRQLLKGLMVDFLFNDSEQLPDGFVPEK